MQKVVYGEWLPVILGKDFVKNNLDLPLKGTTYNPNVNPSIENGFATAAFRFGHSMIQGRIAIKDHRNDQIKGDGKGETERVSQLLMTDEKYVADSGVDNIIYGLTQQPAEKMDAHVTQELTNFLFKEPNDNHGQDLVARNIQRGRDHTLGSYLAYRAKFSAKKENIRCFDQVPEGFNEDVWHTLSDLYRDPQDIDLFTGGLLEKPVEGSILGPTFHGMIGKYLQMESVKFALYCTFYGLFYCAAFFQTENTLFNSFLTLILLADQFKRLRDGDRFFFTHNDQAGSLTDAARNYVLKRKFSDIICDHTDIERIQSDVFRLPDLDNIMRKCNKKIDKKGNVIDKDLSKIIKEDNVIKTGT